MPLGGTTRGGTEAGTMSDITAEGTEILKCTAANTPATPAI